MSGGEATWPKCQGLPLKAEVCLGLRHARSVLKLDLAANEIDDLGCSITVNCSGAVLKGGALGTGLTQACGFVLTRTVSCDGDIPGNVS
jgi:hypothetical protein